MRLAPYEELHFTISISMDEIIEKLSSIIQVEDFLKPNYSYETPFKGKIYENTFRIKPINMDNTSIMEIDGEISRQDTNNVLELRFLTVTPASFGMIFLIGVNILILLSIINRFFTSINDFTIIENNPIIALCICLTLLLTIRYWIKRSYYKQFFACKEIFEREFGKSN